MVPNFHVVCNAVAIASSVTHRASVGQAPHASMGKPSPHGALGIDGGAPAPAPPLELPPPEPPLDAELLVPLPVVVLGPAPVSLQYVGSWVQTRLVEVPSVCAEADTAHTKIIVPKRTLPTLRSYYLAPIAILSAAHSGRRFV
jgi:hypothetical protein